MGKKVVPNGIEILTSENDASANGLLVYVDAIIADLSRDLDATDENFHMSIVLDFSPNKPPKHDFSVNGLKNKRTRKKVTRVLERMVKTKGNRISGKVNVNLDIADI
jgi:hypothetical protein